MKQDIYYVAIINRRYKHEFDTDDFHLEKISISDQIENIIDEKCKFYGYRNDFLIVTNDDNLLGKYAFALNDDDIKLLCGRKDYDKYKTRITNNFIRLNETVFEYFSKIKSNEIISAAMTWEYVRVYPYDDSSSYDVDKRFDEWVTDLEFEFLKTPTRYNQSTNPNEIFSFENIKSAKIEKLNTIFNTVILDIENNPDKNIHWEWRNNLLRYYDRVSDKRFYITQELLRALKNNPTQEIKIKTRLDKNLYIEYFAVGFVEDEFDERDEKETEETRSYDKYNGVYGLDDNTIDSAFDGDPENYWNID